MVRGCSWQASGSLLSIVTVTSWRHSLRVRVNRNAAELLTIAADLTNGAALSRFTQPHRWR
jgi:hypothetical protein